MRNRESRAMKKNDEEIILGNDFIKPLQVQCKDNIQILFSGTSNIDGHWVCSYYDGESIFIYDSLNTKWLHNDQEVFLRKLYPFYTINKLSIQFPIVQQQPNGCDCGVFAVAFAISLLFGIRPDRLKISHMVLN
ncbi:uncharacterized protein LOC144478110 isoform X2 [Augochlora pura]